MRSGADAFTEIRKNRRNCMEDLGCDLVCILLCCSASCVRCTQCVTQDIKVIKGSENGAVAYRHGSKAVMAVKGLNEAMAGGVSALITMPLDTLKTRLQGFDME
ncbi:hypothetical protein Nepgr_005625 [Nepenthes gracilis]|uniref:Uncharacterized protein n=1 Tax=Nepenthes gracilis TaxID=150966 RepID=A0AAD3S3V4_NEPGR|nr:hypothetical protein Nepgr_005625 [Nepenthes gracilis]